MDPSGFDRLASRRRTTCDTRSPAPTPAPGRSPSAYQPGGGEGNCTSSMTSMGQGQYPPNSCASRAPWATRPNHSNTSGKSRRLERIGPALLSGSCLQVVSACRIRAGRSLPTPSCDNIQRQSSIGRTTPGIPITTEALIFGLCFGHGAHKSTPHGCSKTNTRPLRPHKTGRLSTHSPMSVSYYPPAFPLFVCLTHRKSVSTSLDSPVQPV